MNLITKNEALDVDVKNWEGDTAWFSEADLDGSKNDPNIKNNLHKKSASIGQRSQQSISKYSRVKGVSQRSNQILPVDITKQSNNSKN